MDIQTRFKTKLRRLEASRCDDWITTLLEIGEDPHTFFENSDWRNVDFSMSDMRGISFRGSVLDGARFRTSHLSREQRKAARSAKGVLEVKENEFPFSDRNLPLQHGTMRPEVLRAAALLRARKSIVLIGPPGTGKTVALQFLTRNSPHVRVIGENWHRQPSRGGLATTLCREALSHGWDGVDQRVLEKFERRERLRGNIDEGPGKAERLLVNAMIKAFAINNQGGILAIEDLSQFQMSDMSLLLRAARRNRVQLVMTAGTNKFRLATSPALASEVRKGDLCLVDLHPLDAEAVSDLLAVFGHDRPTCLSAGKALAGLGYDLAIEVARSLKARGVSGSLDRLLISTLADTAKAEGVMEYRQNILNRLTSRKDSRLSRDQILGEGTHVEPRLAALEHLLQAGILRENVREKTVTFAALCLEERWRYCHRHRLNGTVKWFDRKKGFGFIKPDDQDKDIVLHVSAIKALGLASLKSNQRISFEMINDRNGKKQAGNIILFGP
ncbi:cold shock domain-containing protein [Rhizobium johnstonii]|uniref:cold shock domain-containing protein n=1 Tax=Rhizobium johnstonii TaxID=3019933 RepID=UPI003F9A57B2